MRDLDRIETIYRVADHGVPLDMNDNYHDTLDEAREFCKTLFKFPYCKYSILELTARIATHEME